MHRKIRKSCAALLLAVLVLLPMTGIAQAADPFVDFTKRGSISILLQDTRVPHAPIPNSTLRIDLVATVDSSDAMLRYTFTDAFQDCDEALTDWNAPELAQRLAQYAAEQQLTGTEQRTGLDGRATFTDLTLGAYLVTQVGTASGYEPILPFLITLPMTNAEGTGWLYEVTAAPKTQPICPPIDPDPVDPPPIDPDPIDPTPVDPSPTDPTPEKPTPTDPCPQDPSAPLIQTGQLNWPIPILALCGLLLFASGFLLRKQHEYEHETNQ